MIEDNEINGVGIGMSVPDGATPSIRSNTIEDNTYGIIVRGRARPVIEGNHFCGNQRDLVAADGSTWVLDPGNEICPAE